MRLNEMTFSGSKPIDGYGPGFFRIGGAVIKGAVLVLPTGATSWGGYDAPEPIIDLKSMLDLIFVGTGPEMTHIPNDFRKALEAAGLGVEPMASPQACRSYNVLLGEGRRVAAALLPA